MTISNESVKSVLLHCIHSMANQIVKDASEESIRSLTLLVEARREVEEAQIENTTNQTNEESI